MALIFWDASGLAKRYTAETGRETVNAIFSAASSHSLATTPWGYAETYSILLRKMNGGALSQVAWTKAVSALQSEVIDDPKFRLMSLGDEMIFAGTAIMRQHNLNATDSAILALLLEYIKTPDIPACVLIASDKRFLRAAEAEGLATLDPEQVSATDVSARLSAL